MVCMVHFLGGPDGMTNQEVLRDVDRGVEDSVKQERKKGPSSTESTPPFLRPKQERMLLKVKSLKGSSFFPNKAAG